MKVVPTFTVMYVFQSPHRSFQGIKLPRTYHRLIKENKLPNLS